VGDPKLVLELQGLKAENQFTKIWGPQNATALQREQRLTELTRKIKRSDMDNLELAFLRKNNGSWAAEEASDPVGQHMKRQVGRDATPMIDPNDGATWGERATWSEARGMPVFSKLERESLQGLLETPQGELQVLGELDKMDDPFARSRAARELAPRDPLFAMMAMAQPQVRASMRQGRKVLANNPKFFQDRIGNRPAALDQGDAIITSALKEFDEDLRAGVREGYRTFIAGVLAARGRSDTSAFSNEEMERQVATGLRAALGGEKRADGRVVGGFDQWNDRWFALPETLDKGGFKQSLARELKRQSANPPVNPDGSTANLYRAMPVAVGGGWYEWESLSGNPIRAKDGKPFRTRIAP
jgi:hypothetical protein